MVLGKELSELDYQEVLSYDEWYSISIEYKGILFYRYPSSTNASMRNYWQPRYKDRKRGIQSLHQEVWKDANNSTIPLGYEIHHIDFDSLNNDPSNLICIIKKEHLSIHGRSPERLEQLAKYSKHMQGKRQLHAWIRSPEGRAWASENAKNQWKNRLGTFRVCENCREVYLSRNLSQSGSRKSRWCSKTCGSIWYRKSRKPNQSA